MKEVIIVTSLSGVQKTYFYQKFNKLRSLILINNPVALYLLSKKNGKMRLIVNQENIRARDQQIATYDCVSFFLFQKSSYVTAQKFILKNHSNSKLFLKSNCLNFVELNPLLPLIHLRLNHLMHTIQRISFPLFLNLSLALPLQTVCSHVQKFHARSST